MIKKILIGIIIISILGFIGYKKYIYSHTFKIINSNVGTMEKYVNGIGNVGSENIYQIGSIYGGKITNFKINEGDYIKKGDLIGKIDSVDLKDKINELKASIEKLNFDIKSLYVDKEIAQKEFNYQEKLYNKNKNLYNKKAISKLSFDKYKLDYNLSNLKIISLKSKINSSKQQQKELIANLKGLNEKLKRYIIYSPVNGYITKKLITNYQILSPNQNIVEITNPKDVWIKTYIDTRMSGNVKIGDKALIKLRSTDKFSKGIVVKIKPVNNSITNEREIEIRFNTLHIPFYLEEQAMVKININHFNKIVKVPNSTITIYNGKKGIWLLNDGKAVFKSIDFIVINKNFSGTYDLNEIENIIIPEKKLKNNMKIIIKND